MKNYTEAMETIKQYSLIGTILIHNFIDSKPVNPKSCRRQGYVARQMRLAAMIIESRLDMMGNESFFTWDKNEDIELWKGVRAGCFWNEKLELGLVSKDMLESLMSVSEKLNWADLKIIRCNTTLMGKKMEYKDFTRNKHQDILHIRLGGELDNEVVVSIKQSVPTNCVVHYNRFHREWELCLKVKTKQNSSATTKRVLEVIQKVRPLLYLES